MTKSSFNGNLFGSEHLAIEDEEPKTNIVARRNFGTKIKEFTAIDDQNCHKKFRDGITLPVFWRLTISVNDENENLLVLPPLDDSLIDKLIIFKARQRAMPMQTASTADRTKFRNTLLAELPAYVHFLLNTWLIETELVSQRYGITHYQNPEILLRLGELTPETRLLQLIDEEIFRRATTTEWKGSELTRSYGEQHAP
jgi:hypothetical protein